MVTRIYSIDSTRTHSACGGSGKQTSERKCKNPHYGITALHKILSRDSTCAMFLFSSNARLSSRNLRANERCYKISNIVQQVKESVINTCWNCQNGSVNKHIITSNYAYNGICHLSLSHFQINSEKILCVTQKKITFPPPSPASPRSPHSHSLFIHFSWSTLRSPHDDL